LQQAIIVGGGISGLSAAYFLEKYAVEAGLDISIHLMESRARLGGVIVSERLDGFLLEGGPDSFLTQKKAAIELCRELGLEDQLIPSNDDRRKTYILQAGQLKEIPDGLMLMVPTKVWPVFRSNLFSLSGKMRLAATPFFHPPRGEEDVSVADYISQRLGRQTLERLAEPLLSAVYGSDVNSLSAHAILQRFVEMEEKYGSLWKGVRQAQRSPAQSGNAAQGQRKQGGGLFVSLREGVGQLTSTLEKRLVRTQVATSRAIQAICPTSDGKGYRVQWRGGEANASALILATPAHTSGRLLAAMDPELEKKLGEIPYHSTMTVSLGFEEASFGRKLDGFGFVVARSEGRRLVACTWVSTKFPFRCPPGYLLLRCFLGGARDPSITQESDNWILKTVLRELQEIMGVRAEPTFSRIHRWEGAMPQYSVGHPGRIQEIGRLLASKPGLFLTGNAYRGIGIPDCVESASLTAAAAIRYLQSLQ